MVSNDIGNRRYNRQALSEMDNKADFRATFELLIADAKLDGRYRTFIGLERIAGELPSA
jgi:hypothetical protein